MPKISFLTDTWGNIKEVDLRPLREAALAGIRLALVGAPGSGRGTLADQMRRDPGRPTQQTNTPVLIVDLEAANQALGADLIILLADGRRPDLGREKQLVHSFSNAGKRILVFINQFEEPGTMSVISPFSDWGTKRLVWGSALDTKFLLEKFVPAVMELVPDHLMGLGRYFPLFRIPIARYLIDDTCVTNAAYSLSTGLAEIVAVLDFPIAVADTIILTKNQAFLAYKLGLALGYSTRWQDYVVEFGGVLGNGIFWRQVAQTLVGLVPVWGILPKTAISYAGTYVVGTVILQWYLTGRHLSRRQLGQVYAQALERGKSVARSLVGKFPHPRLPKRKQHLLAAPKVRQACMSCGQESAADASFCQYCGRPFIREAEKKNASS